MEIEERWSGPEQFGPTESGYPSLVVLQQPAQRLAAESSQCKIFVWQIIWTQLIARIYSIFYAKWSFYPNEIHRVILTSLFYKLMLDNPRPAWYDAPIVPQ